MCLAIPARVVALEPNDVAVVDIEGVRKQIFTALVEDVAVGDYLIVHVGFALSKLEPAEAEETLTLLREAVLSGEGAVAWSSGR